MKCKHGITKDTCWLCQGHKATELDKGDGGVQTLEQLFEHSTEEVGCEDDQGYSEEPK